MKKTHQNRMKNKNFSSPAKSHFLNRLTPLKKNGRFYKKMLGVTFVAFFKRNHLQKKTHQNRMRN